MLSEDARAIVEEEQALLDRVKATLASAPPVAPPKDLGALRAHLEELRADAACASARDLPALFQEMNSVRALLEREGTKPRPDPATPYFAHLRLRTRIGSRDYLLGRGTFADTSAGVRIVDWRFAPIARVFYGYQEGDEFEEPLPGGVSEGLVEIRRIVVVERGELTRVVAGSVVLARNADGEWRHEGAPFSSLGGGSGTAARAGTLGIGAARRGRPEITALLDPDQFEAVHSSPERALLVVGSAGSGKTTVALHRLSQLAFDDPQRFPAHRLRVIVPEEGLARLSRRLLAPLGLGAVKVDTLTEWLRLTACEAFDVPRVRTTDETPPLVSRLKRHPALMKPLLRRLDRRHNAHIGFRKLRLGLGDLFVDPKFVSEVVEAAAGDLPLTAVDACVRHSRQQLATPLSRQLAHVDADRLQTIDGRSIDEGTPDELAGTCDVEDLALMLFLRARAGGLQAGTFAHVLLDEAEDFSLFEAFVLGRLLGVRRSCTLAGDEMQQTTSGFAGWPQMLETIGARDAAQVRLQVAYRCPGPVVELARKVLGGQPVEEGAKAVREGVPVGHHRFPDEAQAQLFIAGALRDLMDREPDASVAVIASDAESARALHRVLDGLSSVRLVLDGAYSFDPGIDVTDVDSVKGLEFDYVIVPDATARAYPDDPEARRRLHVAVTRASHQLWLVSSGTPSPVL